MATKMSAIANSMKGEEAKIAPGVSAKSPQPSAPVPNAAPGRLPVMKKIDPDALVPGEDRPVNPNEKPKPFLKDWQCPKPMTIRAWKLKPARYVVESARELLRVDGEYLDNYANLLVFGFYIACFCTVIAFQMNIEKPLGLGFYNTIDDTLFKQDGSVFSSQSGPLVQRVNQDAMWDFMTEVVSSVFQDPVCGNKKCETPDEMPYFMAAADAREFPGCSADCGKINDVDQEITVDFYDPFKLYYAHKAIDRAFAHGYRNKLSTSFLRTGVPQAGWNLCHQKKTEFGREETVCIFDGDIFVDGLPYRTAELDPSNTAFGGRKVVNLFEGDWELRIVFANFSWFDMQINAEGAATGVVEEIPLAFPAVRGRICHDIVDGRNCQDFLPCMNYTTCTSQFYKNVYTSYNEPGGRTPYWNNRFGRGSNNGAYDNDPTMIKDKMISIPQQENLKYLTDWFKIKNYRTNATKLSHILQRFDDDKFNALDPGSVELTIAMYDSYGDGWNGAEWQLLDGNCVVVASGTLEDGLAFGEETVFVDSSTKYFQVSNGQYSYEVTAELWFNGKILRTANPSSYDISEFSAGCIYYDSGGDSGSPATTSTTCETTNIGSCSGTESSGSTSSSGYTYYVSSSYYYYYYTGFYYYGSSSSYYYGYYYNYGRRLAEKNPDEIMEGQDLTSDAWGEEEEEDEEDEDEMVEEQRRRRELLQTKRVRVKATSGDTGGYKPNNLASKNMTLKKLEDSLPFSFKRIECSPAKAGDGICDAAFAGLECGFDGFDCCEYQWDWGWDENGAPTVAPTESNDDAPTPQPTDADNNPNCKLPSFGKHAIDWPFKSELDLFHVPFSLAAFLKDAIDGVFAPGRVPYYKHSEYAIPSMACPDCDQMEGKRWISHKFTVTRMRNMGNPANYTTAKMNLMVDQMFAPLSNLTHRLRYFPAGSPNLVLVGPIITQNRSRVTTCPTVEGVLVDMPDDHKDEVCSITNNQGMFKEDLEPFGVDPTFEPSSTVYRATNQDIKSKLYKATELDQGGLPFGFFSDQGDPEVLSTNSRFPVVFDIDMNRTRAMDLITFLREGGYLDAKSKIIQVKLIMFNAELALYSIVTVRFDRTSTGSVDVSSSIHILKTDYYSKTSGDDKRMILEITFCVLLFILVVREMMELYGCMADLHSFRWGLYEYFMDWRNALDLANYGIHIYLITLWIDFAAWCSGVESKYHFFVYDDINAYGRWLKAGDGLVDALEMLDDLTTTTQKQSTYKELAAISSILVCVQLLKNLNFHPQFGLISRTLGYALMELFYWLIILLMVAVVYAFTGTLLFGQEAGEFSTIEESLNTCLATLLGATWPLDSLDSNVTSNIWTWSYITFGFLVLLNALIGIICEAYDAVKNSTMDFTRDPILKFGTFFLNKPEAGWPYHIDDGVLLWIIDRIAHGHSVQREDLKNTGLNTLGIRVWTFPVAWRRKVFVPEKIPPREDMYYMVPESAKDEGEELCVRGMHLEFCLRSLAPKTDDTIISLVVHNIMRRFGEDASELGMKAAYVGVQSYLDDLTALDEDGDGEIEVDEMAAADADGDGIMDASELHRNRLVQEEIEIHSIGLGGYTSPDRDALGGGFPAGTPGMGGFGEARAGTPGMGGMGGVMFPPRGMMPAPGGGMMMQAGAAGMQQMMAPAAAVQQSAPMEEAQVVAPGQDPARQAVAMSADEIASQEDLMAHLGLTNMKIPEPVTAEEPEDGTFML